MKTFLHPQKSTGNTTSISSTCGRSFQYLLALSLMLFVSSFASGQATFYSASSGDWSSSSSWTVISGSDADNIPDADDTVIIVSNHTITVDSGSQACESLTVGPVNTNTSKLSFDAGTTLTVNGTVSLGNAGSSFRRGSIVMSNGGTLICQALALNNSSGSNNFTEGTGTVILTGNNTIPNSIFTTFNNLVIASGTTTTSSSLIIDNLTINSGAEFATGNTNSWDLEVNGTTNVSGTLTLANTDTKTFDGNVVINSGGIWNETGAAGISFGGNLQNDGAFTANTGTHTFSGTSKTISGTNGIAIPKLTINGTTTNNGVLTVSTTLAGTSTLTNGSNAILNLGGTITVTTLTASATGNMVNYYAGAQAVKNTSYANLALSGSGTKTFSAAANISGVFSITGSAKATLKSSSNGSVGSLNLGGTMRSAGTWGGTNSGASNINTSYFNTSTNGRITVSGTSCGLSGIWLGGTSTDWDNDANWWCGVPTASTDVVIPGGTVFQPAITSGTTAICHDLKIDNNATLTISNSASATLNIKGDLTNNGVLTAGTSSTVSFTGTSNQVLGGTSASSFGNLVINTGSSAITVTNSSRAFVATGNVTITRGNFITEATDNNYTVGGNMSVASGNTWTHNVDWDVAGRQFTIGGNIAIDGTYSKGAAGRSHVSMSGSSKTVHTGTSSLNIFTLGTTGAITCDGPLNVDNNFWAMFGIGGGSFSTAGNAVVATGALLNSGGTVYVNGGSLTVSGGLNVGNAGGIAGNVVLSSGTLTVDNLNLGVSGAINGVLSQTGGTLNAVNVTIAATSPASTFTCTNSPAINVSGNWVNNGTYTKATETVTFNGSTAITGTSTHSFHNVTIAASSDLTAPSAMNVSGTWTNNGTFTNNSGTVTLNGSSQQSLAGSATSTFHNLTLNNSSGALMSGDIGVNNSLTLTSGNLNIGSKILTMGPAAPAIGGGTFSATRMIIANGGGEVRKSATSNATASYTFPIGDNSGTAEYTPIVLATTGSAYSSAYIGVSVGDAKHPNNASTTHFLTRYWNVTQSGITNCSTGVTGTFINTTADVSGTLGSIRTAQLNGTFNQISNPWVKTGGNVLSGATLTYTSATITAGQTSVFTGITSANPTVSITGGGVTVCQNGPASLTAVPVGDSTFTYAWSGSISGSTTNVNVTPNTSNVGTTGYTVTVKDGNGIASAASSSVNVTVNALPAAGTLTPSPAAGAICIGTPVSATATAGSGGAGTIADELEFSLSGGTFLPYISGTAIPTIGETSVVIRTRRTATGTGCTTSGYNTVTWTMNSASVAGSISGAAAVCSGTNSTMLTVAGHTGAIQWQSSPDNFTFTDIIGETGTTYTAVNLISTTYYRTVITNGICSSVNTPSVAIVVNPVSVAGSISAANTIVCSGTNSTLLTLSGYVGAIQWQSSTNNVNFTDISGANAFTYTATNLTTATYYRAVVTSGLCSSATTFGSIEIQVSPVSVAGTISGGGVVCYDADATLTVSGYTGLIQWQSSPDNISFSDIPGETGTSYIANNIVGTTYYRVVVTSGVCSAAISPSASVGVGTTTTWDGTGWSNGIPTSTSAAIISGNYTATSNIDACSLTIDSDAVVDIPSGFNVTLNGALTVTSGSFTLENNANLLQTTNASNSGNIVVKRNSSAIKRQDYTLWSSPVSGQNLLAFSPLTVVTPTSRFYQYNSSTNQYNGIDAPSAVTMDAAKGYLIRVANNHPTFAWVWNGKFTGVPHNGDYSYTMYNGGGNFRFNLVGNPYPSPISAMAFTSANSANITKTLYFWRETNNNTLNNAYCSWSPAGGGNGTFVTNGEAQTFDLDGVIQTGQGFFVEAINSATQVNFTNAMRTGSNDNQFFRHSAMASPGESESHRIWLNVTNAAGAFCQTAFGYMTDATNGYDLGIEGKYINDGSTELYSIVDDERLVIQGRALPFTPSDVVPLGFKASAAGDYTIAIDHVDGLFAQGQNVYIKDNLTGATHDLATPYTFTSDAGTFTQRFEVVYQPALGTANPTFENMVGIIKQNGGFAISSGNVVMDTVKVFDIRGRLLLEQKGIGANTTTFNVGDTNEVLIVKITSDDSRSVTRKVIN